MHSVLIMFNLLLLFAIIGLFIMCLFMENLTCIGLGWIEESEFYILLGFIIIYIIIYVLLYIILTKLYLYYLYYIYGIFYILKLILYFQKLEIFIF